MSKRPSVSRRTAMRAAGGLLTATGLAGCSMLNPKSDAEQKLQKAKKSHSQYDGHPEKAVKNGWKPFGPYVPGMGIHFIKNSRVKSAVKAGEFTITEPQILLFNDKGELGGIEWGAPASKMPRNPSMLGSTDIKWTVHEAAEHLFAKPDGTVTSPKETPLSDLMTNNYWTEFRPPKNVSPGDEVTKAWGVGPSGQDSKESKTRKADFSIVHPSLIAAHAWVFVDNPNGKFAPVNPEFYQP